MGILSPGVIGHMESIAIVGRSCLPAALWVAVVEAYRMVESQITPYMESWLKVVPYKGAIWNALNVLIYVE